MGGMRKIAAILVADIVGYSRLAGTDEDRTLSRLRGLRSDLIDPAIDAHHGRVVKRTGDGSIVEFRSVVDAVRCAIEVQNGMIERNSGLPPERRIEFRVGIHLGDVVEEADGDLMGDGVNIAARLEGIAAPGSICLSEDAYRQVSGRLETEVTDLGPTQLKNIERPIRVFSVQVGVSAQPKPTAEAKPAPKKRSRLALLGAGIITLIAIATGAWYLFSANRIATVATKPVPGAARLSIVALPFANLSGDPAQDYLADALTDQLTTAIARLRDSFVIAHSTALTYKGKPVDAKTIGKELGVRYVLEGSVQPTGNQVRVNAQLIDAESGAHLWAEQFDTPRADLLQTQDEIVTRLARSMYLQLPEVEAARLKRTPAANPDAEDLALQCQAAFLKNEANFLATYYRLCDQALAADPNNVRALTYLAITFLPSRGRGPGPGDKRADELVSKALALDPSYAPAHLVKAFVLQSQFRLDEAVAEDRRAFDLDPSLVDAYWHMGFVMRRLGEFQTSLELIDKALRLSPRDQFRALWYADKAGSHFALKQYDQAIESARRAIEISPNNSIPYLYLIPALALTGQESQAREALGHYLHLANSGAPRTVAGWKSNRATYVNEHTDPRYVEYWDRLIEGMRKAGLQEE